MILNLISNSNSEKILAFQLTAACPVKDGMNISYEIIASSYDQLKIK